MVSFLPMKAILCATLLAVSGIAFAAEGGAPVLGTAVRGSGGAVFTVPPQSRTVWADVQWVTASGETNTA
ncbi:MAG: hypothetical protein IJK64_01090, partial [Clostridia bacterium]|nr:hypothetical protein [Clostridia bacterium]